MFQVIKYMDITWERKEHVLINLVERICSIDETLKQSTVLFHLTDFLHDIHLRIPFDGSCPGHDGYNCGLELVERFLHDVVVERDVSSGTGDISGVGKWGEHHKR